MKYRKKPVVIEAEQWLGTKESWDRIIDAFGDIPWKPGEMGSESFFIATLEGDHRASKGDWIIRGVQGEYYPCQDDIFRATYELVGEKESGLTTYEDELPEDFTDEEYSQWYAKSKVVDGVRMGPDVVNGREAVSYRRTPVPNFHEPHIPSLKNRIRTLENTLERVRAERDTAQEVCDAELTRTRKALEGLKRDVRGVLDPLNWVTAAGQEVANFGIQVALRTALDRAERVEKGEG